MKARHDIADHPIAGIFPLMSGPDLAELAADIRANGLREAITLCDGKILDGRNRFRGCRIAGVSPRFVQFANGSPAAFVLSLNLRRRHLTTSQRACVAVDALPWCEAEAKSRQRLGKQKFADPGTKGQARDQAATLTDTNRQYVSDAKRLKVMCPELFDQVRRGVKTIPEAKRELCRGQVLSKLAAVETRDPGTFSGLYDVIVIDPPWPVEWIERPWLHSPKQVALPYSTMTLEGIGAIQIPASDSCHLWLWTNHRFLPDAFQIMQRWGFAYHRTFVWHKPGGFQPIGWPQGNCEFALYGRKGSPVFVETKNFPTCFGGRRTGHSAKPSEFYDMVRRVAPGRRLDMFNRRPIPGFDSWGKEAT
jgi:N6-adenosine-specific RNA methylase IME4